MPEMNIMVVIISNYMMHRQLGVINHRNIKGGNESTAVAETWYMAEQRWRRRDQPLPG
jgi:hypothetical protein